MNARHGVSWLCFAVTLSTACGRVGPERPPRSGSGLRGLSLEPFTIPLTRVCNRSLERAGVAIPGIVQSFDSNKVLVIAGVTPDGVVRIPSRYTLQVPQCLPIENHVGDKQTLAALTPRRWIVLWVSSIMIPTDPVQVIPHGIEVFDSVQPLR